MRFETAIREHLPEILDYVDEQGPVDVRKIYVYCAAQIGYKCGNDPHADNQTLPFHDPSTLTRKQNAIRHAVHAVIRERKDLNQNLESRTVEYTH